MPSHPQTMILQKIHRDVVIVMPFKHFFGETEFADSHPYLAGLYHLQRFHLPSLTCMCLNNSPTPKKDLNYEFVMPLVIIV